MLAGQDTGLAISVITRAEILAGMRPEEEERTHLLLRRLSTFPVDERIADTDLLSMSPWRGTPIVTTADFVKRTDAMRRSRKR